MKNKLISFILALTLLIAVPLSAIYKYNPYTRKLDYYERVADADLGDLGDVTLTGLATGNILYYNGTAWVNLAIGANTNVLTLTGGVPTWAAPGAPAAHAASHEVGGADLVDHNLLTNYAANRHLVLPNTLANVLTDHNLLAHTALGLFDASADVDHNATTNYAANQHVVLPNTIANVLSDHNLAAHTAIGIPNPANVFYVSATGGDYTTIQAALTAQNAGGETFLVGPGTYTDTIHFTANDQVVKPLGHAANVIVTQADANIVNAAGFTDCIVEGIEIRLTAPTTAINAIQVGTGTLIIIECRGYLATAVALVATDQPSLIGFTGAGTIRIKRGNYQYYHTGNTGGAGIKATFRANVNLAELHLHKIDVIIVTNSGTAGVTSLFVATGTAVIEIHNCIDVVVTDPNASLVVGLGYVGGGGAHNVQGNHVDVVATANVGYGLYHNGTAIIRSGYNAIHVEDTGGTSYAFYVGASATLNSHFDDLRSDDGNNIAGTFVQVSSPADGDLRITDELDVTGVSEFSGDTNQYEDVFMTWADAADHMAIVQSAVAGVAGVPLIAIDDDRTGVTADSDAEATITIDAEGTYAFYVSKGFTKFAGNTYQIEDVFMTWGDALDNMVISQSAIAGIEDVPLIEIDDDRTGVTANEIGEATIVMDTDGVFAFYVMDGDVWFAGGNLTLASSANLYQHDDLSIYQGTSSDARSIWATNGAGDDLWIHAFVAGGVNTTALPYATSTLTISGMTDHDDYLSPTFVLMNNQGADAGDYAGVVIGERTQANVAVAHYFDFYAMAGAGDGSANVTTTELGATFRFGDSGSAVPANASGPGDVLFEDDIEVDGIIYADSDIVITDPIGADTTLTLDWAGDNYPRLINSAGVTSNVNFSMSMIVTGNVSLGNNKQVTIDNMNMVWDSNAAGDDLMVYFLAGLAATDSGAIFYSNVNPNAMTDHDNYLTATLVLANSQGADANDYAGVVIGERAQADVKVAHYFDFFAMTGATDGSVDTADELGATFRFGDAGSAIPDFATGSGDVLFEDDVEIDGNFWTEAYTRYATIYWNECFDHGSTADKYSKTWDITSLNVNGAGTNVVDTTPSNATMTTDNNAIGDNEGTRTVYKIVQRARQNRTEIMVALGQTANTQFYFGWNDSGTNLMVANTNKYVIVFFDKSSSDYWQIKVGDGATEDIFTSAIAADTSRIKHEIWVETDGTVHWVVNDIELDITGTVDNQMAADDHYLIVGQVQSVTGAAAIVAEIDYVENEKTKIH